MKWNISFYDQRVMKEIENWPIGIKAKFTWIVDLIEDVGPTDVGMPHIKAMKKGLFEIRSQGKEGIGRAFFCIKKGKVIIILSGFIKKTQKTPQKELDLAIKRMEGIKND
jgi:phage-related protein